MKRKVIICTLALVGAWGLGAAGADASAARVGGLDVLCIYYPEWHVYPEGEAIFGKGRTEWDYVDSAIPRFKGHEQPLRLVAGHPDDSNPSDVAGEIDLAADAGIDVFVYDWYWSDGHPIQHEALERGFLRAPNRSRIKFALMWANHNRADVFRTAPGKCNDRFWWRLKYDRDEFLAAIDYCIEHYFAQPEYYRKDGKLFFSIYSARELVKGLGGSDATRKVFAEAQARMARAGLPPLHFSAMVRNAGTAARMAEAGFESVSAYNITPYDFDDSKVVAETGERRQLFSHEEFADLHATFNAKVAAGSPVPFIPVVSRGWDPSPRCRLDEPFPWRTLWYPYLGIIRDLSPEAFARSVRAVRRQAETDPKKPGAILINAWNEYTEGCYLMPDVKNGDAYLRALRHALADVPFPGVTSDVIELEDGVYRLDAPLTIGPERSGTLEKPFVLRAKNRGKVVLSGMVSISDWQKTDLCGGNVWVGTIPGVGEIPGWSSAGCLHKIDLKKLEMPISVFAKGERLTCARWPKAGTWTKVENVLPSGGLSGGVLQVGTNADVAAWAREKDLWAHGLWKYEWADAKCRVLDVDVAKRTIRVDDTMVKFGFLADRDFYVFNALSAIGGPGEWVVDRKSRKLYVWPTGDVHDVKVALLDHLVTAKGVANVRFEGIVFEGTRCETFLFEDVTNVVVDACCFRHTSKEAIRATGARRLKVTGSDFYDLGEGGVWIEGGDIATLERGDNVVDNCHISHFGKVVANYKPGVCMKGSGNAITHNLIHHTDHQAIMFNCTDLYIGWNVIHDTLLHNDDAGAIYSCGQNGRGWTDMRGTLIEHNVIHNSGRLPHSRNCYALYFDDSSSGVHTRWNFVNRANVGVYCGGGNFHVVESNLLVSCARPLGQGNRGIDTSFSNGSKQGKKGPLWVQLAKRYENPAWAARFPETKRILDLEDGGFAHWPLFNRFVGNVEVGCGEDSPGKDVEKRGNVWADNVKLKDETGCRDFLGRDWTLKPDSRVFAALGGDLGFAKAGLYDSDRRFSPAVKFGESVSAVQPPHPSYNALTTGSVAVQFRPIGWSGTSKDKRVCFAEELVNCEPIPRIENILRFLPCKAPCEWTEYSFSFVPKSDLTADIHLLNKGEAHATAYDDFRIVGATVKDDLETGSGWRYVFEKQGEGRHRTSAAGGLVEDSAWGFKAAKGHRFVLASDEYHYVHRVELKKGGRVTVTFKARTAETN